MSFKGVIFSILLGIASGLGVAHYYYEVPGLSSWWQTAVVITAVYFIFRILLEFAVVKRVRDPKARYSFRKTIYILYYSVLVIALLRIWVQDPQTLLVTYGLVGAGVAVALQDFFKNFVGGMMIFASGLYRVGDRIEVEETAGDVVDIGLFYTVLMEIGNWIEGNQVTGRLVTIPNGILLHKNIKNFSKDHDYLWDEVALPITYDSDWKRAKQIMQQTAKKKSKEISEQASKKLRRLGGKYYYIHRETEPEVYTELTDNWIMVRVRYMTGVIGRRSVRRDIFEEVLALFEKEKKITIASATLEIIDLPTLKVKQVKR